MFNILILGYGENGEVVDGTVEIGVANDRQAVRKALDWLAGDERIGGWQCFELLKDWGPGRSINPIDSDFR